MRRWIAPAAFTFFLPATAEQLSNTFPGWRGKDLPAQPDCSRSSMGCADCKAHVLRVGGGCAGLRLPAPGSCSGSTAPSPHGHPQAAGPQVAPCSPQVSTLPGGQGQRAQQGRCGLSGRSSPVLSPKDSQQTRPRPRAGSWPRPPPRGSTRKNKHSRLEGCSGGTTAHSPLLSHQLTGLRECF